MKNRFDGCVFSVKPTGGEVSNRELVRLIGEQDIETAEFQGVKCKGREPQYGYKVSPEKMVVAYESAKSDSALKFEFFVRFKNADSLNPIQIVPDHELSSLDKLAAMIAQLKARIDSPLTKKTRMGRGVFPKNAMMEVKV
jgi:hypothetical protein